MSGEKADISRETLDAHVDGELAPEEMTRVAAVLAERADLKSYIDSQLELRNRLSDSFAAVMAEPVPDRLQETLRASATPRRLDAASWRARIGAYLSWHIAVPAAAALAFGLIVGVAIERPAPAELPFVRSSQNGQVIAQGELAGALSEQLASSDQHDQRARIGISFRSRNGLDCRTFEWLGATTAADGVACHTGTDWAVAALATTARTGNDQAAYQMAGAGMPDTIRSTVNKMIAGAPFDATAERAARADHWSGTKRP
jgi:hypothetical protein